MIVRILLCLWSADNYIGSGSFRIVRKVKRKSDGFVRLRSEEIFNQDGRISYVRMSQKECDQLEAELNILDIQTLSHTITMNT
jgi:hypothetical protein